MGISSRTTAERYSIMLPTVNMAVSSLTLALAGAMMMFGILLLFLNYIHKQRDKKAGSFLKNMPGPWGLPVLGCSYIIGRYRKHWDAFSDLRKKYGDLYGLKLGSRRCVVVSSTDLIREVLIKKKEDFANRPDFLRFHQIFRGNRNMSIALCDWSDKQKKRREIAFPFMHPRLASLDGSRMNNYITSELDKLVSDLSNVQEEAIEPRQFLLFTTANIFYQYLCSKRFSSEDNNFKKVVQVYDLVFRELFQGYAIDFMPWLKVFNYCRLNKLKNLAQIVSDVTFSIFEEHRKTVDYNNPQDLVDIFLCHLVENNNEDNKINEEDAEVIIDDLIGGHSVLGNLWLWGLYLVAAHSEVKEKIRKEVLQVTGNCRAPDMNDKLSMPYTVATTLELLRVISSPIIPHVSTTDTSIQDYWVPKDTMVMFNTYDLNMDPDLWEKPREFRPERFLNNDGKVFKPSYFLPFGTGKRTCLGDGLVKSTLFLGLSTLLQMFEISLPHDVPEPDMFDIPGLVVPREEIKLIFRKNNTYSHLKETSLNTITS